MDLKSICCFILYGLLATGSFWMFMHPTALRIDIDVSRRPYSYSRVQLWFWTVIVLGSFIAAFWYNPTGEVNLNSTCLALLGIGGATAVAGRVLDTSPEAANRPIDRRTMCSDGFVADILSDDKGISINRFQAAVFNLVMGATFILRMITALRSSSGIELEIPEFDAEQLELLGISSATYIALKTKEPSASAGNTASTPGVAIAHSVTLGAFIATDELPDVEVDDMDD